jgi:hypothetical protein
LASRKSSLKPRHQPPFFDFSQPLTQDPSIKPVGDGHQFSYQPAPGADQLSPRSSSSSSSPLGDSNDESASIGSLQNSSGPDDVSVAEMGDDDDDGDDDNDDVSVGEAPDSDDDGDGDSDGDGDASSGSDDSDAGYLPGKGSVHVQVTTTVVCDFTIEDIGPFDTGYEELEVLYPTEIESNRSRSRSRHNDPLDLGMMDDLKNLNCSNEASDNDNNNDDEPDAAEEAFLRRQQEIKRMRRLSMGSSFGKRTHSELSDSDDDAGFLDVNDVGSSARRLRKRLHRGSLLFQDPPAPRIDELDEPDSSEDEFIGDKSLASELPYWTMEIMEVDSS